MSYTDPTGDWLSITTTLRAALKTAGDRKTKAQMDAWDAVFRSIIALITGGGTVVEVTLSVAASTASHADLVDTTPKLAFIGGVLQFAGSQFEDTDVWTTASGTLQLGAEYPADTLITFLV